LKNISQKIQRQIFGARDFAHTRGEIFRAGEVGEPEERAFGGF
jgi:hypothetical protein